MTDKPDDTTDKPEPLGELRQCDALPRVLLRRARPLPPEWGGREPPQKP